MGREKVKLRGLVYGLVWMVFLFSAAVSWSYHHREHPRIWDILAISSVTLIAFMEMGSDTKIRKFLKKIARWRIPYCMFFKINRDLPGQVVLRVLVVENSPERQQVFRALFRDHAWIMVNTAKRAITMINSYRFDLIALDYDLDGPGNGYDVAYAISNSQNTDTTVLIHAMNSIGAGRIMKILPHAKWVPFSRLIKNNASFKRIRKALEQGVPAEWQEHIS